MTEPIATYRDANSRGQRRFELHPDCVVIRCLVPVLRRLVLKSESVVALNILRPDPIKVWLHDPLFRSAPLMLILSLPMIFFAVFVQLPNWLQAMTAVVGTLSLAGSLATFAKFGAKIEYVQFQSQAGLVLLDVGRSGPDKVQFDDFVERLVFQIDATQLK